MIIILFLLTKILWTFLCQRRVKEIIFRSLDLVPSHAHRNCNDFIFYSGYMAGSLLMYLYICNNEFQRRQRHPTPVRLLGKSYGRRSLVGCSPWGREESYTTARLHFHFSLSCIGEGNGNPLQGSCLENPRDRGAWWAAVYGVAQSRTRLKRLSSRSNNVFILFKYKLFSLIKIMGQDRVYCWTLKVFFFF